jgi:hypothetical protein
MTLSDEFALLMASVNPNVQPKVGNWRRLDEAGKGRTSTVYSVAEALKQKRRDEDAKLGAGSI